MAQLGIPLPLNYEGLRSKPFWRLREQLALQLLELSQLADIGRQLVVQKAGAQGYPSIQGTVTDVSSATQRSAMKQVRRFITALQPWQSMDDLSSEEEKREELLGESQEMIEAWIAHFEPDNLQAYQEQVQEALKRAENDARE